MNESWARMGFQEAWIPGGLKTAVGTWLDEGNICRWAGRATRNLEVATHAIKVMVEGLGFRVKGLEFRV